MKIIYVEISIVLMFLTGILQWDFLNLQWEYFRTFQAVHIISSLFISFILVIPFIYSHTKKYKKEIVSKKRKSTNGMLLGIALLIIILSGIYLFLVGNRGGDILGEYSFFIHLYGSFILIFFLWYHSIFSNPHIKKTLLSVILLALIYVTPSEASLSSSSLYLSNDAKYIYSANLDGGSISKIDSVTGEKVFEKHLGVDIRRISFKSDESVYGVTDYMKNMIIFLDNKNHIIKKIKTKNKPHAIIYDEKNHYFFVTVFEDNELLVIDDKKLNIIKTIKTLKTPRGLALTDDGRLLVSHAMIGVVSIYDAKSFKMMSSIKLHSTQNIDELVSQGLPRLLDDIEIKPDGSEAWLPHVLWNFDHPFQFQSTVFPTISVISLKIGEEKELLKKRKHLFKSINIKDNSNKTMIVSNPWDLAFSKDGAKAFVTLAGSEDLMVFNVKRSMGKAKRARHRKRGKRSGKGSKATQILRAYPNYTNPRALLINPENNNIYVQNASRLDMTLLDSGGTHPFARVKVKKDRFAKLVKNDPLSKELRDGKSLFNNGNTNTYKSTPMAGDFWMSCNSCHFEGFNFTNGFLFSDTKLNKHKKASIGHDNLNGFISKTPLADYIRISRDTQGGMGADKKAKLIPVVPDKMDANLSLMMGNLHTYVRAKENLRYLSNWIKLEDDVDKYHVRDWTNSAKCKSCHNDIFNQWADSNHRNLGGTNPYYMVLENLAALNEGEEFRQWCMGCHNPSAVTTGIVSQTTDTMDKMFQSGAKTLIEELKIHGNSKLEEGVSCITCHRITKIEDAGGNASYTLNLTQRKKYALEDSDDEISQWLSQRFINSKPQKHIDSYMKPIYKDSLYCASCHDEFSPGKGVKIVSTFKEWEKSKYNNPDDESKHKTCIDCHMTYMKNDKFAPLHGRSTDGGKIKEDVKVHYFSGSNHFLSGLKSKEHEEQTLQLLRTSAKLDVELKGLVLKVGVTNVGAGHHLPTGVSDFRELWLDITLKDRDGTIVFQSGKLKDDGNLGDDARVFMKVFGDKDSKPVGLLFWKYEKLLSDTRIPAGQRRVETFAVDNLAKLKHPLSVSVKLNFRIYPQWVTDEVKKTYPQLPNPPVVELKKISKKFN